MDSVEQDDNTSRPVPVTSSSAAPFSAAADRATRIGIGQVIAEKFRPLREADMPQMLFPPRIGVRTAHRFIRRTDGTQLLIYTDGACLGNGSENPKVGCAFVYGPSTQIPALSALQTFV
jgi:hypothetical protein